MRRRFAVLLLLLAACAGGGEAPFGDAPAPLVLQVQLTPHEVPLLGEAELVADLFVASGEAPALAPQWPDGIRAEAGPREQRAWREGTWVRQRFRLRPTRLGEHALPPLVVEQEGRRVEGPALQLTATTVLGSAGSELEAPAPPFEPRWRWWLLWPLVALLAIAALVAWSVLRLRRRPRDEPAATALPPHVRALRELARLRTLPRITRDQIEQFHVEISAVLRRYVEERFGLHAPERTTEEFLAEAETDVRLAGEQRASLRGFLAQCDLVKFARAVPDHAAQQALFDTAEQFVETTRADREPVAAKGAA